MRATGILKFLIALAATSLCGCSLLLADRNAQEQRRVEMTHVMDTAHVYVTNGDIPKGKPYKVLGQLEYTAPFSTDAIDSAGTERKLKAMALERYHDEVDAVIKENIDVNANGDTVIVTGDAIQFESSADRDLMHKMWDQIIVSPR